MSVPKPKPCPVCDAEPVVGRYDLMIGGCGWQARCPHGHLDGGLYRDRSAAIHSWNAVVCDVEGCYLDCEPHGE